MAQFDVNSTSVESIISSIKAGEIAIPEIQRPFVWDASKVRDLMDSLYKGFPVGYIIVWKNPDIRLKDGNVSFGKKILIDGQQRITAIQAAVVGQAVVDASYKKKRIVIAFNPIEEIFEVCNPAIEKDSKWIPDISAIFDVGFDAWEFVNRYCETNGLAGKQSEINRTLMRLMSIKGINLGVTELSQMPTIDEVTDIFIPGHPPNHDGPVHPGILRELGVSFMEESVLLWWQPKAGAIHEQMKAQAKDIYRR